MGGFYGHTLEGDARDAHAAGYGILPCHWCKGWAWWNPNDITPETRAAGRVFCSQKACELREAIERDPSLTATLRKYHSHWPDALRYFPKEDNDA